MDPLPDRLIRGPVPSSAGPRRLMDGPLFTRSYRGVRTFGPPSTDAQRRVEEAALVLPEGGVLAAWAAALIHAYEWTDGESNDGTPLPVLVIVPLGTAQIRVRPGLKVVRGLLRPGDATVVDGLPVTSPTRTAFDEVRMARDGGWALARADVALRSGKVAGPQLVAMAETRPGWRGVVQARTITPWAVSGAESLWESRLRWLWIVEFNVVPLANVDVYDGAGDWIGRSDLLDPVAGLVGEFDGESHGNPGQRALDLTRDQRFQRAGLVVVRMTSPMVTGPGYPARSAIRTGYATAARRTSPPRFSWSLHPR